MRLRAIYNNETIEMMDNCMCMCCVNMSVVGMALFSVAYNTNVECYFVCAGGWGSLSLNSMLARLRINILMETRGHLLNIRGTS